MVIVEPSFLAETCTPSSFWPEAEVIEPFSNWSAEAVLAAPVEAAADERPRDRVFDLLMRRFDALQPYRGALSALHHVAPRAGRALEVGVLVAAAPSWPSG